MGNKPTQQPNRQGNKPGALPPRGTGVKAGYALGKNAATKPTTGGE